MAKEKFTGVKGMNDMLPQDAPIWQYVQKTCVDVLSSYGYQEIRTPILENTRVFTRGVGEVTDIVEKEMYSFTDSMNGDQLTLRPECTSAVVRAVNEHNLLYGTTQRLWYCGPMFRHERPQRGRYRQFHQLGAEALGMAGPDIDAEIIMMLARMWKALGVGPVKLEMNTLGAQEERQKHREALIAYFEAHKDQLDEDALRRLYTNPLRILDTKNPDMQGLVDAAPKLLDYLGEESRAFLSRLEELVSSAGIEYSINPRLVRGLDYYNHTVFEWITDKLGAQGTICGGGRYDDLTGIFGMPGMSGVGISFGADRIYDVMTGLDLFPAGVSCSTRALFVNLGPEEQAAVLPLLRGVRDAGIPAEIYPEPAKMKKQMEYANRRGVPFVVIVGSEELAAGAATVKNMQTGEQSRVAFDRIAGALRTEE